MAEFPLPPDTAERYAAIEQAYVEDHWTTVLSKGENLLKLLEQSDDPEAQGLANRVRLLLGHAHLYGLSEPEVAEDYYHDVLAHQAETELRRIATEGLQQCQRPTAPRANAALEAQAVPVETTAPVETAANAAPLESGAPAHAVEEPLLEALAPATALVEPQEAVGQAETTTTSTATSPIPPESPAPSLESAATPTPAAAPWAEARAVPQEAAPTAAINDPFLTAVTAAAAAKGSIGAAPARAAMPWLADLPEGVVIETLTAAPSSTSLDAPSAAAPPQPLQPAGELSLIPSLEVEVVEEPELLEVVQADPKLSEEFELELTRIRERRKASASPMDSPAAAVAVAPDLSQEDPVLVAGLLRVVLRP
ncbi:MAG: hypothetical protein WCL59_01385 [Cyanobium sp. ELA507]